MTLIAVARTKFIRAADGTPETDWTTRDSIVKAGLRVLELTRALRDTYSSDAHLVTYVVNQNGMPLSWQPRVRKQALETITKLGYTVDSDVLFCDVDNPDHSEWTPELFATAMMDYEKPILRTCGIYHTQHGRRFVQPLDEPVQAGQVERYLTTWLHELEDNGISPDWACRDWTRMFRLPNVRRGGDDYRTPFMKLDTMEPRRITPAPETLIVRRPKNDLLPLAV